MPNTGTKHFTLSCCFDVNFEIPKEVFEESLEILLTDMSLYDEEDVHKVNELKELDKTFKQDPVKVFKVLAAMSYKAGLRDLLQGELDNECMTLTQLTTVVEETPKNVD